MVCSSYESKVYEVAKKRNTIALLGTATDKSGITNMLIKAMSSSDSAKRLIIVLAPTVNLVKQACLCLCLSLRFHSIAKLITMAPDFFFLSCVSF